MSLDQPREQGHDVRRCMQDLHVDYVDLNPAA